MRRHRDILAILLAAFLTVAALPGESTKAEKEPPEAQKEEEEIKAVPLVLGYSGFITTLEPGKQTLTPVLAPIFLAPFGERWLLEAEFEMEGEFEREDGSWNKGFETSLEYLQLDFLANRYVTVVAGRFLTPFGIFNERLHPLWIKNLQPHPLIFPMESGSSNGAMLRGGIRLTPGLNLNYSGYYSTLSTRERIESGRAAGGRWGIFLPAQRLEVGGSFRRDLEGERSNRFGFDATWQLPRTPLDFRGEYAHSTEGSGYWVEGAYRLRRIGFARPLLRRSQVVVRFEQFFAPAHVEEPGHDDTGHDSLNLSPYYLALEGEHDPHGEPALEGGHHGSLPDVDTVRLLVGWNYYFSDGVKFSFAYGRNFAFGGDTNLWSIGLSYRF